MTFSCHKSHQPPRPCLGTFSKFDKKWSKIFFRNFGLKRLFLTNFYINHNSKKMTFFCHKCHQPPRPCLGTFSKFDKKWWTIFFVILVLKGYFDKFLHKPQFWKNDFFLSHCTVSKFKMMIFFRDFGLKRLFLTNFYTNHNFEKWLFLVTKVTNHLDHVLVLFRSLTKNFEIFFSWFWS
jgi:hypothetical protein